MSLYLQDQKLGSHSSADSSSHKFMLKGRQAGGMHRGHGWVFRAESHDTMLAWYEDIKNLTEKTGFERDAFVRKHARSISGGSYTGSVSSDGVIEEDDADQVPYSATPSQLNEESVVQEKADRPQPGGRFPSDINVNRHLQMPLSPSSGTSSDDRDAIAAAGAVGGTSMPYRSSQNPEDHPAASEPRQYPEYGTGTRSYPTYETRYSSNDTPASVAGPSAYTQLRDFQPSEQPPVIPHEDQQHQVSQDIPPGAAGVGAGGAGAAAYKAHQEYQHEDVAAGHAVGDDHAEEAQARSVPPDAIAPGAPLVTGAGATQSAPPETLVSTSTTAPALAPAFAPVSSAATPATTASFLSDSTIESQPLERPVYTGHKSTNTISDLHIPGEYPRGSVSAQGVTSTRL